MILKHLLSPLQVDALHLPNRIVMAPLTRGRAGGCYERPLSNTLLDTLFRISQ
jgi:2,4-dienoyl-CoA reductase-like NADH-dependent reductase (Old Yellow Enzyme family)